MAVPSGDDDPDQAGEAVLDNGLARLSDLGLLTPADQTASLVGTLKYMPPDRRMDTRADVYAAGLVIYEILTGLPAESFPRFSSEAYACRDHPALAALNRVVLTACQIDPQRRYQDAREMADALEAAAARPASRPRRRLAWVVLGVMAVAAAALVFARRPAREPTPVDVNFITVPYEAEILLDGERLEDAAGKPYRTPCTVPGLSAGSHNVIFRRPGLADHDAGQVDSSTQREVIAHWDMPAGP